MKIKPEETTTQEHFTIFTRACVKWQKSFGLEDWELNIVHEADSSAILAWIIPVDDGRVARVGLNKQWTCTSITPEALETAALHEILEIMFRPLVKKPKSDSERHSIINRLVHFLMFKKGD